MRFKGTLILLLVCIGIGCFIFFYEIKGGEEREKAKEAENRFWMLESKAIQQIELQPQDQVEKIVAARKGPEEWSIQVPRPLEADSDEMNRLAESAAEIKHTSILEETGADPAKFGLSPAEFGFKIKAEDEKEYEIRFGDKNPAGNSRYAGVAGREEIFLVSTSASDTFDKKLDDLRNHSVLEFEQTEVQSLDIQNQKGAIHLVKDSDDRWWIEGKERVAADSPGVRGILNALALGRIPEFFDEDPSDYVNADLDKPIVSVNLTYGKDKAIKSLSIGSEKAKLRKKGTKSNDSGASSESILYLAKDASRTEELFFVNKDLVDKLDKSPNDLRDKSLAAFQRWDIDSINLENTGGNFTFSKSGGEWFFGDEKKKANFDAVTGILDALESDYLELIDKPSSLSPYGLDKPTVRVVLKQGSEVVVDCSFGKKNDKGVYAQLQGDSSVKVAVLENYEKLNKNETDYIEAEKEVESDTAEE
ncbi:MAG: DUF4340 domain-containing protein [Acidobacteriota bacterium]